MQGKKTKQSTNKTFYVYYILNKNYNQLLDYTKSENM